MKNKKLTIQQSILWNTGGSLIYLGVQWLQTVLVARMLGYEDAGIFSLAMSVTNIFFAISIYGMKNFQVSDVEQKYSAGNYVLSRIITGVGAFGLCVIFVVVNGYDTRKIMCIVAYMVFKLSESIFDVFTGFYQKHWRMDVLGKSLTIRAFLMFFSFLIGILVTKDLLLAIIMMMVAVFLVIIFYDIRNIQLLETIQCFVKIKQVKSLLLECLPLAIYLVLSTSVASIPRYFLEIYHGNEQLGIYASVAAPTLIVQMAATYIFNPMVTVFAESYGNKDKETFIKTLYQCVMATVIISSVGIIGAKLVGKLGLRLLYGNSIVQYEYLLIPLIVCTITTAFVWLFCAVLTVLRNFRALLLGNSCAVLFSIVLSMVLIPIWGMQGTTYALLLGNVIGIVIFLYYMAKDIKEKFTNE